MIEPEHRSSARHSFRHHNAKRLIPKNWHEEGGRFPKQPVLLGVVNRPDICDLASVDMWQNMLVDPAAFFIGNIACDDKAPSGAPRNFDGKMRALDFLKPPQKHQGASGATDGAKSYTSSGTPFGTMSQRPTLDTPCIIQLLIAVKDSVPRDSVCPHRVVRGLISR